MAITAEALLIFEDYFKKITPINGSVDWAYIKPHVITAQDIYIERFLGSKLIDKLKAGSLTTNYTNLLDNYVRKALVWWTMVEALPHLRVKIDNGSLVIRTSEDTTAPDADDVQKLVNQARRSAEDYTKRMMDYVANNLSFFPEYSTNTGDDIHPHDSRPKYVPMEFSINKRIPGSMKRAGTIESEIKQFLP